MTAWTAADSFAMAGMDNPPYTLIILKAIPEGAYTLPEPYHPDSQVNPDGVTFTAVANLPSLTEPDVTGWVAGHQDGSLIMACFSRGLERGQVSPDCYEVRITVEEKSAIKAAAHAELAAYLGPRGFRTDHLTAHEAARENDR